MPDYLVTVIKGTWSAVVYEANQASAAAAQQAALNQLSSVKGVTLGDTLRIVYSNNPQDATGQEDYLVPLSKGAVSFTAFMDADTLATVTTDAVTRWQSQVAGAIAGAPTVLSGAEYVPG